MEMDVSTMQREEQKRPIKNQLSRKENTSFSLSSLIENTCFNVKNKTTYLLFLGQEGERYRAIKGKYYDIVYLGNNNVNIMPSENQQIRYWIFRATRG